MEEARKIYFQIESRTNEKAPYRFVQLARSTPEVLGYLGDTDKYTIESLGKTGLQKAREFGYARHARQIEKMFEAQFG